MDTGSDLGGNDRTPGGHHNGEDVGMYLMCVRAHTHTPTHTHTHTHMHTVLFKLHTRLHWLT